MATYFLTLAITIVKCSYSQDDLETLKALADHRGLCAGWGECFESKMASNQYSEDYLLSVLRIWQKYHTDEPL